MEVGAVRHDGLAGPTDLREASGASSRISKVSTSMEAVASAEMT
jgi:hypothetical protein